MVWRNFHIELVTTGLRTQRGKLISILPRRRVNFVQRTGNIARYKTALLESIYRYTIGITYEVCTHYTVGIIYEVSTHWRRTRHFHIDHNAPCIHCFHFLLRIIVWSQEKSKTVVMQNFGW